MQKNDSPPSANPRRPKPVLSDPAPPSGLPVRLLVGPVVPSPPCRRNFDTVHYMVCGSFKEICGDPVYVRVPIN